MALWLADLYAAQYTGMDIEIWVEPFAGGLGAALTLLDRDHIGEAWFAEANPAIAALWRTIIRDAQRLANHVADTTITLDTFWHARETVNTAFHTPHDTIDPARDWDWALAALTLNRCSRSGIVAPTVGPIGGKHQTGRYTLTDRFTPDALAARIARIGDYAHRLRYYGADGIACIEGLDGTVGIEEEMVLFVDPPYIQQGNRLYAAGMDAAGHARLADALHACAAPWLVTYDDDPRVLSLYPTNPVLAVEMPHLANTRRIGHEYVVFGPGTLVPRVDHVTRGSSATWVRPLPAAS